MSEIVATPGTRGGQARIDGTRITVVDVLGWLASGMSRGEICQEYGITDAGIRACLEYAAACVRENC